MVIDAPRGDNLNDTERNNIIPQALTESRTFEPITEAELIPENIMEGDIVRIIRSEPGVTWTAALYIRNHWVDRLKKWNLFFDDSSSLHATTRKWKLYVTGAQAVDKTCFFWMCAIRLMQKGSRVLFIQYLKSKKSQIWILEKNQRRLLTKKKIQQIHLGQAVDNFLETQSTKFDLCICDGVQAGDLACSSLVATLEDNVIAPDTMDGKISKLVLVTSFPFRVSLGTEMVGSRGIVYKISFDSWREEDYEKAVRSDLMNDALIRHTLLTDVGRWTNGLDSDRPMDAEEQILEVVRQKYEYAGGCARYMFDMDFETLKETLDELCFGVLDWKAFTKNNLPAEGTEAINSLMQQFSVERKPSMYTPVSKYILLRAYDECRAEVTAAVLAAAVATSNRSLRGWAFELDQKDKIYSALQANRNFFRVGSTAVANGHLKFFPQAEARFDGESVTGDVTCGSVIWCSDCNQPLFDVAFYFHSNLVTLQFTVSDHHSLHLEYMQPLCIALANKGAKIESILHMAVLEDKDVVEKFKFDAATGRLKATRSTNRYFEMCVDQSEKLETVSVFRIGPQATSAVALSTRKKDHKVIYDE